jgi:hypothetical protein
MTGIPYARASVLPVRYGQTDGSELVINAYFVHCPICGEQFMGDDPSIAGPKDTDLTGEERLRPRTPEDQITKSAARKYGRHWEKVHAEPQPQLELS